MWGNVSRFSIHQGGVITAFASSLGPCVEDGGAPRSQSTAGDAPPTAKCPEGEAPCGARCRNCMAETLGSSETAAPGPGTDAKPACLAVPNQSFEWKKGADGGPT